MLLEPGAEQEYFEIFWTVLHTFVVTVAGGCPAFRDVGPTTQPLQQTNGRQDVFERNTKSQIVGLHFDSNLAVKTRNCAKTFRHQLLI